MAENISLAEIKSLLVRVLDALNVAPAATGTAGMIALKEQSDDGGSAVLAELPVGAFATVPKDALIPSTPAPADNPRAPTYLCCACGVLNNPPPHEPNPYYAVTKGLAVGVIRGVANVMPLTWKVPGSLFTRGPGEHAAIAEFNEALAKGNVKILPA
ncbi:hypothetical protein ARMSODRAFT_983264 [Armillaria solidipes]|uniref:Uncharacterized protein n=1 Tax=Armillaria solidipes TaxID=1076256 RepID=A0A2H3AJW9_9AGAR|nr:hypothetical protein ARMSODRAFT_983264 [Armillaria solidipes]